MKALKGPKAAKASKLLSPLGKKMLKRWGLKL
jgi:hypothetical protein